MSEKYLSPTDYLLTNVNGQVLTITLNRPDALNSIRPEMLDGIRTVSYTHLTLPTNREV